jgi:hypothetical protein
MALEPGTSRGVVLSTNDFDSKNASANPLSNSSQNYYQAIDFTGKINLDRGGDYPHNSPQYLNTARDEPMSDLPNRRGPFGGGARE